MLYWAAHASSQFNPSARNRIGVKNTMEPTTLVYSSHDRSNLIHDAWIVQRALRGNKRILFLPLSTPEVDDDDTSNQRSAWEAFHWFFRYYDAYGLDAFAFVLHAKLRREDVDALWDALADAEVVILGGGNPSLGMLRFEKLGAAFHDEPGRFRRILHGRKAHGKLTAGFSAGADQLCQVMSSASGLGVETPGLALATDIIATSHFETAQEAWVTDLAKAFKHCMAFGLPNDSALAISEGRTGAGKRWQVIQAIIDTTWDRASDAFHIKTRQGVLIFHAGFDGRTQRFGGGDAVVRLLPDEGDDGRAFIVRPGLPILDYQTDQPTPFTTIEELLAAHAMP
jgi:peptidase E